jgi:hypothetical protein
MNLLQHLMRIVKMLQQATSIHFVGYMGTNRYSPRIRDNAGGGGAPRINAEEARARQAPATEIDPPRG